MEYSIGIEECLTQINKESLKLRFLNISIYFTEMEYIQNNLLKPEIKKIVNNKKDDKTNELLDHPQEKLESINNTNLNFSMELNLFFKVYMFILRQCIGEFLFILNQLNFILTKDGMKGPAPKTEFTGFFSNLHANKYNHLENDILTFLNNHAKEFATMRFIRNKLKNGGQTQYILSLHEGRPIVKLVYKIDKIDDGSLNRYLGDSDVPFNASYFESDDLELLLKNFSDIVFSFNIVICRTLTKKCIKSKYMSN